MLWGHLKSRVYWHQNLGGQNGWWDTSSCTHKECKIYLTIENSKGKIIGFALYIFGSNNDKTVFITTTEESFFLIHSVDINKTEKQSLTLWVAKFILFSNSYVAAMALNGRKWHLENWVCNIWEELVIFEYFQPWNSTDTPFAADSISRLCCLSWRARNDLTWGGYITRGS